MLRLHLEPTGRWSEAPEDQLEAHRRRLEDACGTAMRNLLLELCGCLGRVAQEDTMARSEVQVWLTSAVSRLPVTRTAQRRQFSRLLPGRSGDAGPTFARALLTLAAERHAPQVAAYIAREPGLLRAFFNGSPRRVMLFFEHFSMSGTFILGARALSRFAFANRDTVWDFLEWMGKHAQAPVTVASKPHYFCELHVLRTVRNFVERVPEFWESPELLEEVRTGEILHVDLPYFVSAILDDIGEGREDALRLVESYLEHEDYAVLCRTLLPLLHPSALLCLLDGLLPLAAPTAAAARGVEGLGALVLGGTRWATVDDAMLHSALATNCRPIMQLMADQDPSAAAATLDTAVAEVDALDAEVEERIHWAIIARALSRWPDETERMAPLLQGLVLRLRLHRWAFHMHSVAEMVPLLQSNGVEVRVVQTDAYEMLRGDSESESDCKRMRSKRKHKKKRRKASKTRSKRSKRARAGRGSSSESESDDTGGSGSNSGGCDAKRSVPWDARAPDEKSVTAAAPVGGIKIGTDGFEMLWTSPKELCDHLADHALACWLRA